MRAIGAFVLATLALCAADDRIRADNDLVRIIRAVDAPGARTALHRHEFNRVMIYLDDCQQTITYEDGRVERHEWKADQVAWSVGGPKHVSENTGSAACTILEVELKQAAPAVAPARKPELDPVAIDPTHNLLLFENGQVRVIRTWREPGGTEMMHEHAGRGRVAVLLTNVDARVKSGEGTVSEMHAKAREALWSAGAVRHAGTNTSDHRFDMFVVEVK